MRSAGDEREDRRVQARNNGRKMAGAAQPLQTPASNAKRSAPAPPLQTRPSAPRTRGCAPAPTEPAASAAVRPRQSDEGRSVRVARYLSPCETDRERTANGSRAAVQVLRDSARSTPPDVQAQKCAKLRADRGRAQVVLEQAVDEETQPIPRR